MNYRYFYSANGEIVGYARYRHLCFALGMNDSVGYIDSDLDLPISDYQVSDGKLVPKQ